MNEALSVFVNARQAGVTFEIEDGELMAEGPFTDEMLTAFRANKAELLKLVTTANRLLRIAKAERIDPALVEQLSDSDLADCSEEPDEVLTAFLRGLSDSATRRAGQVPEGYTQHALCRHCGPIWLFTEGTFDGCPWCWNRLEGLEIPRPPGGLSTNKEE